jgi:hypothetical protein
LQHVTPSIDESVMLDALVVITNTKSARPEDVRMHSLKKIQNNSSRVNFPATLSLLHNERAENEVFFCFAQIHLHQKFPVFH